MAVAAVLAASLFISTGRVQNVSASCSYGYLGSGPAVTGVWWNAGAIIGGTSVTVTGCGFTGATAVKFGGTSATFTVLSDSKIRATSPAHAAGVVDVQVATAVVGSTSPANGLDLFRYVAAKWCGLVDMSRAPTVWVKGHAQRFYVTVLNCGLNTWPALGNDRVDVSVRFTTRKGSGFNSKPYWKGLTYRNLAANAPSNAVVQFAITLNPAFTGTVFLEAEMIKLHQFWFGRFLYRPPQFADVVVGVS